MASEKEKTRQLVAAEEEAVLQRTVLIWLNTWPDKPVDLIRYEPMLDDAPGMALSAIQGAAIDKPYLYGGYRAEYPYKIVYRIKPGNSIDKRLQADELLNRFGDWLQRNPPDLGAGLRAIRVRTTARATLFAVYENGDEDHQILMSLTYETI